MLIKIALKRLHNYFFKEWIKALRESTSRFVPTEILIGKFRWSFWRQRLSYLSIIPFIVLRRSLSFDSTGDSWDSGKIWT